jgi:acetyl-CoA acyltransferase 1
MNRLGQTQRRERQSSDDDVVIVAALRTPLTRSRKGGLAKIPAYQLLSTAVKGVLDYSNISGTDIDDICVGNVLLPPAAYSILRMAIISEAGIPSSGTGSFQMVNRQCASGLQAVSTIANSIAAGEITIGIGAGVESMSQTPMNQMKLPDVVDWDSLQHSREAMDCLLPMGMTSDTVVHKYGLDRHELDQFAVNSHQKATEAQKSGKFQSEIIPCHGIYQDDGIRPTTNIETLSKLKAIFTPTGATTAGNSSQTTDGAAAVLLMKRSEARRRRIPILAIWRGFATAAVPPDVMGIGPAVAIPAVLKQNGLTIDDIDVFEINEAFASQATWCVKELKIPVSKVNPSGGAIALGHPLGATGARLLATLIQELHRRHSRYGVVSMCIGTGMGAAAVIEVEAQSAL